MGRFWGTIGRDPSVLKSLVGLHVDILLLLHFFSFFSFLGLNFVIFSNYMVKDDPKLLDEIGEVPNRAEWLEV